MGIIDYDRSLPRVHIGFLNRTIATFTKQETETILNNISINGIYICIDLFGVREAFLRSLPNRIKVRLANKIKKVKAREAYEFLFRAEVISRIIKKLQK